ncbi:gliding motility-associated C-terminal domain-containing protein [Catalinimonas alkaloidigena]|uniref:T9SS type B sorting domain-containing protein n=1 Tax=Catalinimonas alkaloidigena TaxID=1075417 RepID=UPI00115FE518|nr:gliding motility-associated C-terminal domain-containing protein [Catalinimonas alkaloidigena]
MLSHLGWGQSSVQHLYFNSTQQIVELDFATEPPTVRPLDQGSGGSVGEGIAQLEDSLGNVILWVNARGVYDRNGERMPGSEGIFADPSATEIAICPDPGSLSRYYLIYNQLSDDDQAQAPLFFSVVDLTKRNRAGDVILLNQSLDTRSHAEGLEVVPIPCSNDYWLLAYRRDEGFVRFRVTEQGIEASILIAPFDADASGGRGELDYYQGHLGYAVTYRQRLWVGDFDPASGEVANARTVPFPSYVSGTKLQDTGLYGLEFSPDGTKVYCTDFNNRDLFGNVVNPNLFRYDLISGKIDSWTIPPATENCSGTPQGLGQLELAPDGNLYVCQAGGCGITVIEQPDAAEPTFTTIPVTAPLSLGVSDQIQAPVLRPFQVSEDQTLCAGDSVFLWATGGLTYQWSPTEGLHDPTSARPMASPKETTVYTVRVDRGGGCVDSAQVALEVSPRPTLEIADQVICAGDTFVLSFPPEENTSYILVHHGTETAISLPYTLPEAGPYELIARHAQGCETAQAFRVTELPSPKMDLPEAMQFCGPPPYIVPMEAEVGVTYRWSTGATTPHLEVDTSGTYWVEATQGSCTVRDSIRMTVAQPPRAVNIITPNGDGRNERLDFGPLTPQSRLTIYNRWGKLVYTSDDYQNEWRALGEQGKPLPAGLYYYHIDIPSDCGESFKGWVQVLR